MIRMIRQEEPIAMKQHSCDGFDNLNRVFSPKEVTEETGKIMSCKGIINVGESYIKQTQKDGPDIVTWKCCVDCMDILRDLEMLED